MPTLLDLLAPTPHGFGTLAFYEGETMEWSALWSLAERCSGGVAVHTSPGDRVAMLMEPSHGCVAAFVGAFLAGCDVVSLPARPRGMDKTDYAARIGRILDAADVKVLFGGDQLGRVAPGAGDRLVYHFDTLASAPRLREATPSLIQFSSGTTGEPKGVIMPLDRLSTNIMASISVIGDTAGTQGVSWLPWTHDMGLIGALLVTWTTANRDGRFMNIIPTETFIKNPASWMQVASDKHARTTMTPAFALRFGEFGFHEGSDLSGFKHVIIGGERVDPDSLRGFTEAALPYGFDPTCLSPSYGMAENGVAVTVGRPGEMYRTRWVRADWERGLLVCTEAHAPGAFELVGCGRTVGDIEVTIEPLGATSAPSDSAVLGHIVVSSSSLFSGYVGGGPTDETFRTGDIGALMDGELWVLGRTDDVIVAHGENYVASDIERTVTAVRPGGVAVCSDPELGGYAVVCEGDVTDAQWGEIIAALSAAWGARPSRVGTVAHGRLPRTSSSKLQRRLVIQAVERSGAWR